MWGTKPEPQGEYYGVADGTACKTETGYTAKVYDEKCWMWQDYQRGLIKSWNWTDAQKACPAGWHLPSSMEFNRLIGAIGPVKQLFEAGWAANATYWSSTPYINDYAYGLYVKSADSITYVASLVKTSTRYVRCVAD